MIGEKIPKMSFFGWVAMAHPALLIKGVGFTSFMVGRRIRQEVASAVAQVSSSLHSVHDFMDTHDLGKFANSKCVAAAS
jgi:hypothetical protein